MKREIIFLIILSLLLISYQKIFAQSEWAGVSVICKLANFFANLTLVFCIFAGLKFGYDLMMSKGSAEELSSAKKAMVFVLVGGALAVIYKTFLADILGQYIC